MPNLPYELETIYGIVVGSMNMLGQRERSSRYPVSVRLSWVSVGFSLANCDERVCVHAKSDKKFGEKDIVTNCEPTALRILENWRCA